MAELGRRVRTGWSGGDLAPGPVPLPRVKRPFLEMVWGRQGPGFSHTGGCWGSPGQASSKALGGGGQSVDTPQQHFIGRPRPVNLGSRLPDERVRSRGVRGLCGLGWASDAGRSEVGVGIAGWGWGAQGVLVTTARGPRRPFRRRRLGWPESLACHLA